MLLLAPPTTLCDAICAPLCNCIYGWIWISQATYSFRWLKEAGVSLGTAGSFKSLVGDNLEVELTPFSVCCFWRGRRDQVWIGFVPTMQSQMWVDDQVHALPVQPYKTTPNPLDRLTCIVKEHYLKVFPQIQSATLPT